MSDRRISLADRASEVSAVAAQYCEAVDREGSFPNATLRALKDARLLGAMIPKEFGGEGATLAEIADICCILAQQCASSGMIFAMHQIKVSSLVTHGVDSAWHREFMRTITSDQWLIASSTTEEGVGGDLRNSICAIERCDADFTLEKNASVISYGAHADAILATARRAPDAPGSDQVLVALTKGQYTLDKTGNWDTLGMRATCSEGFKLKARAPATQILPKPFAEIAAQSMLATSHILWSSVWYGIAASAMSRAQAFVRADARRKPGTTPSSALRLADAAHSLHLMKCSLDAALRRFDLARGDEDMLGSLSFAIDMNNLKVGASQLVVEIVQTAMSICGIVGYKNGTPYSLGRHLRDAMSAPLMINNDRILSNTANLLLVQRLDQRLAG